MKLPSTLKFTMLVMLLLLVYVSRVFSQHPNAPGVKPDCINRSAQTLSSGHKVYDAFIIVPSPGSDDDLDGLTTEQESSYGTNPSNSDSDGGGENDGSEVLLFSQDPLDPSDDSIQAIPWFDAAAGGYKVTLHFGVYAEYNLLRLYRSLYSGSGYELVDSSVPPTGEYVDDGLTEGTTYYYRIIAVDNEGHQSRVSPTRWSTPFVPSTPGIPLLLLQSE